MQATGINTKNEDYKRFSEITKGDVVSGTYDGIGFCGRVHSVYVAKDSPSEGAKSIMIRLIPNCKAEGLPVEELPGTPEPRWNRGLKFYVSDTWTTCGNHLKIDEVYTVRF